MKNFQKLGSLLWDAWCVLSVVGIWPRFIEPKLLQLNNNTISISNLPQSFENFKIIHLTDLHLNPKTSDNFLKKILNKVNILNPDLIVFTGDFICFGQNFDVERLNKFLSKLQAPYGKYAIYGNHDYSHFVSVNENGDYDVITKKSSSLTKGFARLFSSIKVTGKMTTAAKNVSPHQALQDVLKKSGFKVLNNETIQIKKHDDFFNLTGLGEYMTGQCNPKLGFQSYKAKYPGIVMSHNPDSISLLNNFPGNIILSGHTHGAQVNLPIMWKKFMLAENPQLKRGLYKRGNKSIFINRGLGAVIPFRWFSLPEIVLHTLTRGSNE
ncbi:putative metallophosphoesterase [Candidatus Rubidus massiliensis]|nr:putative metallophosphoesterase [Candidatus Rubidus massiliensis]